MPFFVRNDRRASPRANLAAPCPCFFKVHGKRRGAYMVDLSAAGAGFRNYEQNSPLNFSGGETVDFDVITPFGRANYQGEVAWATHLEGGHAWGMRLRNPLATDTDPLGSLWTAALTDSDATDTPPSNTSP
jgi:hypothetical protein